MYSNNKPTNSPLPSPIYYQILVVAPPKPATTMRLPILTILLPTPLFFLDRATAQFEPANCTVYAHTDSIYEDASFPLARRRVTYDTSKVLLNYDPEMYGYGWRWAEWKEGMFTSIV